MDEKDNLLQEQSAPLKNTDHAFVKVGQDGEPIIPNQEEESSSKTDDEPTTLKHR